MQSSLQAIAYLNLQYLPQLLPQPQPQSQWPYHLHYPRCIYIIPNTPHDSRRALAEVSASNQVKLRPTYLSGLEVTGLPTRKLLSFPSMLQHL